MTPTLILSTVWIKILAIVAIMTIVAAEGSQEGVDYEGQFAAFIQKYQKTYLTSQFLSKFDTFRSNLDWINNQRIENPDATFTVGVTEFADLSQAEFEAQKSSPLPTSSTPLPPQSTTTADNRFIDWREYGMVTPVRNRGNCQGGCWATSAADNLASNWAIRNRLSEVPVLSAQELIDCTKPNVLSCRGGSMKQALNYSSEKGGICLEKDYPWQGKDGICKNKECDIAATNLAFVTLYPSKDDHEHINRLQVATLAVAMNVSSRQVQFYTGGIINQCENKTPNYGVLNVGYQYDEVSNQYYYIIKNDFGTTWGMEGYMYVAQHVCGLHTSDEDVSAFVQPS